jgi:hypothetical protein
MSSLSTAPRTSGSTSREAAQAQVELSLDLAVDLLVQSISAKGHELVIRLRRDACIDVGRLIELVSRTAGASLSPTGVLTLTGAGGAQMASWV